MRSASLVAIALLAASVGITPARAEDVPPPAQVAHQPKCPEEAEPLPPELAAWASHDTRIVAATAVGRLADATVPIGRAVDVELKPTPEVDYPARPANPGGSVSRGGLFRLDVVTPGVHRVAVGARSWIDVVVDGKSVVSVAHGHGPACSGMRKVVDYDLPVGVHILQLAASDAVTTEVLVARKP